MVAATTATSRAAPVARTVLRGRSEAMATALSMMRRVRAHGRGGVLVLEGEPGIGKSAVFAAIAEQAAAMQFACGVGKADQIGRISPAAPLLLALRSGSRPVLTAAELAGLAARTAEPLLLLEDVTGLLERRVEPEPAPDRNRRHAMVGSGEPVRPAVPAVPPGRLPDPVAVRQPESGEGLADDLKRPGFGESRIERR